MSWEAGSPAVRSPRIWRQPDAASSSRPAGSPGYRAATAGLGHRRRALAVAPLARAPRGGPVRPARGRGRGGCPLRRRRGRARPLRRRDLAALLRAIDEHVERSGTDAPEAESDPSCAPIDGIGRDAPGALRLDRGGVGTVIWCTGMRPRLDAVAISGLADGGAIPHTSGSRRFPASTCSGLRGCASESRGSSGARPPMRSRSPRRSRPGAVRS